MAPAAVSTGNASLSIPSAEGRDVDIPFEILYRIVDDVHAGPGDITGIRNALINLSRTSHTLARYCRPLLFHTVSLHCSPAAEQFPDCAASCKPAGDVRAFNKIIQQAPSAFSLIKHLNLNLVLPFPTPAIGSEHDVHSVHWFTFFNSPQPHSVASTLTRLDLRVIFERLSGQLLGATLEFLAQASTLESLSVTSRYNSLPVIFGCLPSGLKELTLYQMVGGEDISRKSSNAASLRATVPNLQAFTVTASSSFALRTQLLVPGHTERCWVDLTTLKHLQLEEYNVRWEPTLTFNTFILPSAMTLQCLHLPVPSQWGAFTNLFPGLGCFPSLRCLEVAAWPAPFSAYLQGYLASALRMLSNLVEGSVATDISRVPKVSVLGRLVPARPGHGGTEREWIEAWNALGNCVLRSNLRGFDVFGYVQVKCNENESIVSLGSYGPWASPIAASSGARQDYSSLWEEGPCCGWECAVPSVAMLRD
ncbi:hypothetical protein BKA70DRAFT_1421541 [Coprinopsis sp. MPI-PUGE-AT-0042]|nr:hypothetical protein BKA70DRAFT_1421541 [Coprinopsis sp. MPI-PUGE-AT-0042]